MIAASIIVCLLLSAFFSGIEIAFVTANRLSVELEKKKGSGRALVLSRYYDNPSNFLATTLVGNNIVLVIYGSLMDEKVLKSFWQNNLPWADGFWEIMGITTISTIIILFLGEYIPKNLFRLSATNILFFLTYPFHLISILLRPVVWVMVTLSNFILKTLLGFKVKPEQQAFTRLDLENFVNSNTSVSGDNSIDRELFQNALYLNETKVRDCMVPRTEIEALDINDSVEDLKNLFAETRLSRILVYDGSLDEVVGYVHHLSLLQSPKTIAAAKRDIHLVPDGMPAQDLMNDFIKTGSNIAWVVDEYGSTAGVVTLEDILEEIFGEIDDEYDTDEGQEVVVSETEFVFAGRLEIDYLNDKYSLNIPTGDYNTLSGYIISETEEIPLQGQEIIFGHLEFIMEEVSDTRIMRVRVRNL